MSPETRVIIEILLAVATGASALVIRLTVSQSKGVAEDVKQAVASVASQVKEIGDTVRKHGESLAAGNEKFRGIERRLDEIEETLEKLMTEGCARGRDCIRSGE